ncbi:hypothetical protein [Jonesia quinghaiensis]|uniref:hypothetical protein n=1 Tax=Jonesia quinghaiensis TaxID=262806 RepID=UPI000686B36F|nr:hypothetical protein [Jonesia quinghaiensis]
MSRATFPSPAFPAYPALSMNKPEGWVELAAVGLPLAIAADVPAKQFRPNVLVTMTRHGVDHSMEAAERDLASRLKRLTRFREESRVQDEAFGGQRLTITGRFSSGRGEIIHQVVTVVVINRGYVYDVVEITGTCSAQSGENIRNDVVDIMKSLDIACE